MSRFVLITEDADGVAMTGTIRLNGGGDATMTIFHSTLKRGGRFVF